MLTPGPPEPTSAAGSPPAPLAAPGDRALARRTFVGFFVLYLLFAWPAPLDPIAGRHLARAEAMARGRVGVGPLERDIAGDLSLTPLADGTFPPHHFGPGASVLAAPLCAVVQALAPAPHEEPAAEVRRRAAVRLCEVSLVLALLVAPFGAATVVLLARLLERAALPRPWEAAYAWGLGLSFPLSTTFGPHVVGLGLAVAGVFLATSPARWPLGSSFGGFLVGASVLCDPGFALVAAAPVAVWLTWRLGRDVWPFASGAAAAGALFVVRNAHYYGHPLRPRAPFDALPVSLREGGGLFYDVSSSIDPTIAVDLLVGGRIGLFVCAPALLLGVLGLPELWRRRRDLALLVATVALLALAQNVALGGGWYSGTTKGPRYMLAGAFALAVPLGLGLTRWPRLGVTLLLAGALISWVQAQTPFYGEVRSSVEDVLTFGPRLRLVQSLSSLIAPGQDAPRTALVLSPLLAFPVLLLTVHCLAPPERRRQLRLGVFGLWAAVAAISQVVQRPEDTRGSIRLREVLRQVPGERFPVRLEWYGQELLAYGRPVEASDAFLRSLERGGWDARPAARRGLADVMQALEARGDDAAAARVVARAVALQAASAAPVGSAD